VYKIITISGYIHNSIRITLYEELYYVQQSIIFICLIDRYACWKFSFNWCAHSALLRWSKIKKKIHRANIKIDR